MKEQRDNRPVEKSLKEYARGIAGGLLFSFPLLYTMEVWWIGFIVTPLQLIMLIVATYILLLGYNHFAGMRADASLRTVVIDSVEEMGIGILISFILLLLLNRIDFDSMSLSEVVGKTLVEAMAVSIGVSIGTAQLGGGNDDEEEKERDEVNKAFWANASWWQQKAGLVVLALCGSVLIGGNVAPTEEVTMLAFESTPVHILLMAVFSLVLSALVVFFSDFKGTVRRTGTNSVAIEVITDTCLTYLVALGSSAVCLWFFGRFDGVVFQVAFAQCIVLGVLSSLGASAGRLLIK
ncbi:TIGR02587 family membrane protein [Pontibacter liquoris]|uniref:TIGR02587 family membrane protein n=1 Tax=Pontibacter liquoris TaxID=2905677 RepID=UPI001FA7BEAF|nr:TIGR02587 family membrane protein [Pontibacter liquoris]